MNKQDTQILVTSLYFRMLDIFRTLLVHLQEQHYLYIQAVPGGNVPDFGRMFLTLKYTDITQNTYIRSSTVTERMAREV